MYLYEYTIKVNKLEYLKIKSLKLCRDWSLLSKQGIIFWHDIFLKV